MAQEILCKLPFECAVCGSAAELETPFLTAHDLADQQATIANCCFERFLRALIQLGVAASLSQVVAAARREAAK